MTDCRLLLHWINSMSPYALESPKSNIHMEKESDSVFPPSVHQFLHSSIHPLLHIPQISTPATPKHKPNIHSSYSPPLFLQEEKKKGKNNPRSTYHTPQVLLPSSKTSRSGYKLRICFHRVHPAQKTTAAKIVLLHIPTCNFPSLFSSDVMEARNQSCVTEIQVPTTI